MRFLILALTLSVTPAKLDQVGRDAYHALRDFQRIELTAVKSRGAWPTSMQHEDITAKLLIVRQGIDNSLVLGMDVQDGKPISPQTLSLMRHTSSTIKALSADVDANAPKDARSALAKLQQQFAKLAALFPLNGLEFDEHPPKR